MAEEGRTFEPDPGLIEQYAERLELYRELQGALPPITRSLQAQEREQSTPGRAEEGML